MSTDTTLPTVMLLRSWRRRSAVLIVLGFFATSSCACGACALAGEAAGRFAGLEACFLLLAPPAGLSLAGLSLAAGASIRADWAPLDDAFGALRLGVALGGVGLADAPPPPPPPPPAPPAAADVAAVLRLASAMTSARCT